MENLLGLANLISGLVIFVMGAFLKHLNDKFKDQGERIDKMEDDSKKLPETYARRDDVKSKFDEVLATLNRIDGKIDNMKDQRYHG